MSDLTSWQAGQSNPSGGPWPEQGEKQEDGSRSELESSEGHDIPSSSPDNDIKNGSCWTGIKKRLTVTFKDLSILVNERGTDYCETFASRIDPRGIINGIKARKLPQKHILHQVTGQVRPGEMLLVVGRPGSGCTSLLRMLANDRASLKSIQGEVHFGNADHVEAKQFRHQMILNNEDDIHFPTLSVAQTLEFALWTNVPDYRPDELKKINHYTSNASSDILGSLAIGHTADTLVGNEFVRGVSGGERKRVSIAEVMAGQAPVQCWDNSTRGLDASTALDFGRTLRSSAQKQEKTVIASFYQTGNALYNLFDKVLVLCEGREIYHGPRELAKSYFEDMGFICPKGGSVADFLTGAAVHTERKIKPGFESSVPNTADEFEQRFKQSKVYIAMIEDMVDPAALEYEIEDLKQAMTLERQKSPLFRQIHSAYTVSLWDQTIACAVRSFQIMWGDRWSLIMKVVSALVQALMTGSLFYNLSTTSSSVFLRPGALFFGILYFCLQMLSETTASFMGRPIISRHKRFGFYRPTAYCIAAVLVDIPIVFTQVTIFTIVYYFMVHFQVSAAKFFTYWVVLNAITLCFASQYRAIGALFRHFGNASKVSGTITMIMMIYSGYLIPFTSMHVWFRWIFWINPASYAFESLMGNEWSGLQLSCQSPQYLPYGASYDNDHYRACSVIGSNGNTISGDAYIASQYNFSRYHVWRGFGVIIGFWIFFACLTAIGFEMADSTGGSAKLLFKRGSNPSIDGDVLDEEKTVVSTQTTASTAGPATEELNNSSHQSIFTWKDLDYFVNVHGDEKQLLQKISGFARPGQLVALMGTSGAGKTTLMDVLAQRKDAGRIEGSIHVNGKPQDITFQRTTGYCEQMDVHESTSTVRESLLFSARLRQEHSIPDQEKVDYVEEIIDLLELRKIKDAIVGEPGAGLNIEQRKRLTLGVELVAKPRLLFLDEPTSGLDGQSAFNIVRFMRKLADSGQVVICTVHQPSAALFDAFDSLLLLAKGGRTTYFGKTGENSTHLLDYFARNGATCDPDANPAEHIIDVVQGRSTTGKDWVQIWEESPERQNMMQELESLDREALQHAPIIDEESQHDQVHDFATPIPYQIRLVTIRQSIALWRNPDYVWNKIHMHILQALFAGFTFWMIGDGSFDLQLRLMAVFNFVFVAPGMINQLQPLFLRNRDVFETREKKSKTYHWLAFIVAECVSEIPWLIICGTVYFACWYFTAGFPVQASISGQIYVQMLLYEFLYTAIGQAIATYSPNAYFASLLNPVIIGAVLINFCGVVVPYDQIVVFWRYWIYYLNPFSYLVGGLLAALLWDVPVNCKGSELTDIPLPSGQTCGEYMSAFLGNNAGYIVDGNSTSSCQYCPYKAGAEYAQTFNLKAKYYGWRDVGITALFCIASYGLVVLMMKIRTKATKRSSD
ncbi:hypothetical protein P152DRAFT_470035 [Eremomyces bilateralis CBS 781.70]|uniref:ABC transporter domain-containing protein n=1 Tax=Eremomyces bilateralis CBS 781.70 TaxID=1392243 RepID=A0A6G1GI55_9PEZI|nr:uncharacterized protein P152DRAFT_470035 [Eremomyces bilateralis CBS 781.70]KAF1817636.1 hypothetical protein P152DRAFT_470035 [Eremomyces bilateralis CBS 781.70]